MKLLKGNYIKKITKTFICSFIIFFTLQQSFASETLKIGTMDLPPYGWQNKEGKNQGIIYELNEEIGIRSGMKYTNTILPFNRMLKMLKNGKIDLISSQAHSASLTAGDKLSIQFLINVIAGTKKDSNIQTIQDFKNSRLIYHRSASYSQLKGLPSTIERVNDYKQIVKIIYSRKGIDGGIFSEPAYYFWMKNLGLSPKDFGNVIMIEKSKQQWILVRKNMPKQLREKLKTIVNEIYNEKMYEKLLIKYGKN